MLVSVASFFLDALENGAVGVHILFLVLEVLANLVFELSFEDFGTVEVDIIVL